MTVIEKDAVASVHYTGTLPESGEVFDSSEGRDPLTFLVGHKQMIPGFEEELMGAEKGERRTFTLEPERAYGPRKFQKQYNKFHWRCLVISLLSQV